MGTPNNSFHEFTRQASFFFREKIKTARLTLTDVTPAQLLTEEATNGDSSAPDAHTMGLISRAAFEVDDYWRIVDVLHKRLLRFDRKNWRPSYKALILLEHLLTHGPERVAEEFQCEKDVIKEMKSFQYVDERGFNWGLSIGKKSEKVLKLLEDMPFLREERARARKLTSGIKGFGSFCLHRSSAIDGSSKEFSQESYGRCNSYYNYCQNLDDDHEIQQPHECESVPEKPAKSSNTRLGTAEEYSTEENHPFCDTERQSGASLLSP